MSYNNWDKVRQHNEPAFIDDFNKCSSVWVKIPNINKLFKLSKQAVWNASKENYITYKIKTHSYCSISGSIINMGVQMIIY